MKRRAALASRLLQSLAVDVDRLPWAVKIGLGQHDESHPERGFQHNAKTWPRSVVEIVPVRYLGEPEHDVVKLSVLDPH